MFLLMHLFVPCLDPISVKSVVPKSTLTIVSGMGLVAINAPSRMRAWSTLRGRADRGGLVQRTPFTATGKSMVVLLAMRSHANGTLDLRPPAYSSRMTPLPALLTERRAQVSPGSPEHSDELPKLDHSPDECLGVHAADQISNIHIDGHCI
jgi:hypothetical protein